MKKILILAGGYSKEKEISLQTAKSVFSELNNDKSYNIKVVNPDGKFVEVLRKFKPNTVLNFARKIWGRWLYSSNFRVRKSKIYSFRSFILVISNR